MVKIRPNPKLVKRLEEEDKEISLLSKNEMKKKIDFFASRESKLKHLIEPRPISVRIKKLLAATRSRRLKSRLSRLRKR